MNRLVSLLLFSLLCAASAQTPTATPSGPPATLDALEGTYRANLMKMQLPIMQQYLKALQSMLAEATEADKNAILFEINRINTLITEGTPIDLSVHKEDAPEKPAKNRGIVFTLDPDEAKPPHAKDSTLALGTASWPFSKLDAGKYELIGLCALPAPLPDAATITVTYHGITRTLEVKQRHITKSSTSFRPLSLCTFTLTEDVLKEDITITASGATPWLFTKQLRLVKAGNLAAGG